MKTNRQSKIDAVNSAKSGSDLERVRTTTRELSDAMQQAGGQMYEQAEAAAPSDDGASAGAGSAAGENNGGEDVVEGQFTEA